MLSTRRYRLQRRGRAWAYRRHIPCDLVALIGRGEFVRTLRASSLRDARRLAALLDARVWLMFGCTPRKGEDDDCRGHRTTDLAPMRRLPRGPARRRPVCTHYSSASTTRLIAPLPKRPSGSLEPGVAMVKATDARQANDPSQIRGSKLDSATLWRIADRRVHAFRVVVLDVLPEQPS